MSGTRIGHAVSSSHDLPVAFVRVLLIDTMDAIESITVTRGHCQIQGFGTFRIQPKAIGSRITLDQSKDKSEASDVQIGKIIASRHALPTTLARTLLLEILHQIKSIAAETGRCQIRGFGTFKFTPSPGRQLIFEQERERSAGKNPIPVSDDRPLRELVLRSMAIHQLNHHKEKAHEMVS